MNDPDMGGISPAILAELHKAGICPLDQSQELAVLGNSLVDAHRTALNAASIYLTLKKSFYTGGDYIAALERFVNENYTTMFPLEALKALYTNAAEVLGRASLALQTRPTERPRQDRSLTELRSDELFSDMIPHEFYTPLSPAQKLKRLS